MAAINTGYETLLVGDIAVGPSDTWLVRGARSAIFYVDPFCDGNVRFRYDGTSPTAELGAPLLADRSIMIAGKVNVDRIEFIRGENSRDRTITVHCFSYERLGAVDMGLGGDNGNIALTTLAALVRDMKETQDAMLLELKRLVLGSSLLVGADLPNEKVE